MRSIRVSYPNSNAVGMACLTENGVAITDIFTRNMPSGSGRGIGARLLKEAGIRPGQIVELKGIINSSTIEAFELGLNPLDSLVGKLGKNSLEYLGLKVDDVFWFVERGKLNISMKVVR